MIFKKQVIKTNMLSMHNGKYVLRDVIHNIGHILPLYPAPKESQKSTRILPHLNEPEKSIK